MGHEGKRQEINTAENFVHNVMIHNVENRERLLNDSDANGETRRLGYVERVNVRGKRRQRIQYNKNPWIRPTPYLPVTTQTQISHIQGERYDRPIQCSWGIRKTGSWICKGGGEAQRINKEKTSTRAGRSR
jgi:hypothetical protein